MFELMRARTTLMLLITLFMNGVVLVGCGSTAEVSYQPPNEEYVEYVSNVIYGMDWSNENEDFSISNIEISQGITVNGNPDENYKVFFITCNGEYALLFLVTYIDNKFHSSYGFDDNTIIDTLIKEKTPIALFLLDMGVLVGQTEFGCFQITAFNNFYEIQEQFPDAFKLSYEKEVIVMSSIPVEN